MEVIKERSNNSALRFEGEHGVVSVTRVCSLRIIGGGAEMHLMNLCVFNLHGHAHAYRWSLTDARNFI